jgi:hypothetical protein
VNSGARICQRLGLLRRALFTNVAEEKFSEVTALMKGLGRVRPPTLEAIYACLPPTPILGQLPPYRPVWEVGRVDVYIVVLGVLEDIQSQVAFHGCATAGEPARVRR